MNTKIFYTILLLFFTVQSIGQVNPTAAIKPGTAENQILITRDTFSADRFIYKDVLFDLFNDSLRMMDDIKVDLSGFNNKKDSVFLHPYLRNSFSNLYDNDEIIDIFFVGDSRVSQGYTVEGLRDIFVNHGFDYAGPGVIPISSTKSLWTFTDVNTTLLDNTGAGLYGIIGHAREFTQNDSFIINSTNELAKFNQLDIFYLKESTSTNIKIKVDNVDSTYTTLTGSNEIGKITISTTSTDNHEITITNILANNFNMFDIVANDTTKTKGIRIHNLGNAGQTTALQYNLRNNDYLYSDITPDLTISRLGANDLVNDDPTQAGIYIDSIFTAAKRGGANDILILGETDNTIGVDGVPSEYNAQYKSVSNTNEWAFYDLLKVVPNWIDFRSAGLANGGDNVHENEKGGFYLSSVIYRYFKKSELETSATITDDVNSGTVDMVAYYSTTDKLSSSSYLKNGANGMEISISNNTASNIGLKIRGGNNGTQPISTSTNQMVFSYSTGNNYSHRLISRHTSTGNGLHFYGHKTGVDGNTDLGTAPLVSMVYSGGTKIGINTDSPTLASDGLHVNGILRINGGIYADGNDPGTNAKDILVSAGSGTPIWTDWATLIDTVGTIATQSNIINGSGTNNFLSKWTASKTLDNSLFYDNATQGAYGTSSPLSRFHFYESSILSDNSVGVTIENGSAGDATLRFKGGSQSYSMGIDNSKSDRFKISISEQLHTNTVLTVDPSTQYLGFGTSQDPPGQQFDIGSNDGARFRLTRTDISTTINDTIGVIEYFSNDSDGSKISANIIGLVKDGSGRKGALSFGVSMVNNNNATEAMILDENGDLGVGTSSPDARLDVEGGSVRFSDYGIGNKTGTKAYLIGVESDGDLIEIPLSDYVSSNLYTSNGTLTGNRIISSTGQSLTFSALDGNDINNTSFSDTGNDFSINDTGSSALSSLSHRPEYLKLSGSDFTVVNDANEQIILTDTETNSTAKTGTVSTSHYTNSEEPFTFIIGESGSAVNELHLGGGDSGGNAASVVSIYTAANTTTTTGTLRMKFVDTGDIQIYSDLVLDEVNNVRIVAGSGTPEGNVTAGIGSTYHRTNGSTGTAFYVKETGTGNTGWVAK